MKKKDLKFVSGLFSFKTIVDEFHNEYIIFQNSPIDIITNVQDKTAFEAVENHVHLFDNIKRRDFKQLVDVGNSLGKALLYSLQATFPQKSFVVYVSICIKDSMIIRFHQKWMDESYYYTDIDSYGSNEKVLKFESL